MITDEETRLRDLTVALQGIIAHDIPDLMGLPVEVSTIDRFLAVQMEVIKFYGLLGKLRVTYMRSIARDLNVTKSTIISAVELSAGPDVTHDQLLQIWDVLCNYSEGIKNVPP